MAAEQGDTVAEEATVAWDPEVAAMVGPGLAQAERELDRILSPAERLMFLRGYTYRCQQEVAEMKR
jgi:hypothetical protein